VSAGAFAADVMPVLESVRAQFVGRLDNPRLRVEMRDEAMRALAAVPAIRCRFTVDVTEGSGEPLLTFRDLDAEERARREREERVERIMAEIAADEERQRFALQVAPREFPYE
jgi:hypothetical protein